MALTNKTMKLHVQNTIWLVSLPSSAKQQREMSIFQVLQRTRLRDVKLSLDNSQVDSNGKTPTIVDKGRLTGRKMFLIAAKKKALSQKCLFQAVPS